MLLWEIQKKTVAIIPSDMNHLSTIIKDNAEFIHSVQYKFMTHKFYKTSYKLHFFCDAVRMHLGRLNDI